MTDFFNFFEEIFILNALLINSSGSDSWRVLTPFCNSYKYQKELIKKERKERERERGGGAGRRVRERGERERGREEEGKREGGDKQTVREGEIQSIFIL